MSAITTELQLRVNGVAEAVRGLNEVSGAADRFGRKMSLRQEFMSGQRLQSSITSALGINNPLTQAIDSFERLQYMAEATGQSMSQMFRTIGLGAVSTAAAVGGISLAWGAWGNEVEKTNKLLREGGYQEQSKWEFTKQLFGFGEGIQTTSAMTNRLMKELDEPTVASRLEDFRKANPRADENVLRRVRDELVEEERLRKESYDKELEQYEKIEQYKNRRNSALARQMEEAGKRAVEDEVDRAKMALSVMHQMSKDIERGNDMRRDAMSMAQSDFHRGPQFAGITLAGSHEARLDTARTQWEKSFDLQETANDYLRQLVDKTSATIIYGIN